MKRLVLTAALLLGPSAAYASSDAAWAKFNLEVAQGCAKASGLQNAHISRIVGFDDTLGKVAALVSGRERLKTRAGWTLSPAKRLCVYDKRSKRIWVDEAAGWSAPDLR